MKIRLLFALLTLALPISQAWADETLKLQKIKENIYAIVGELNNRTPENLGNNATFGVVITKAGVVLIDSGGTFNGAKAIHAMIKSVTDSRLLRLSTRADKTTAGWAMVILSNKALKSSPAK